MSVQYVHNGKENRITEQQDEKGTVAKPVRRSLVCKKTLIYCTTSFIAFHKWENAPDQYKYLGYPHRHVFHVKVQLLVDHDNRHIEFINLKQYIDSQLTIHYSSNSDVFPSNESCEMMCEWIARMLADSGYYVESVDVSEDGENGATKYYS